MTIKASNGVYSAGIMDSKTSGIQILPVSYLDQANSPLYGLITDDVNISGIIEQEQNFFYRVESYNGEGGLQDVVQLSEEGIGEVTKTTVLYGDFNNDGFVDAADYSVWQNYLGSGSSFLNGNGTGEDLVVQADYDLWYNNFGNSLSNGDGVYTYFLKREIPFRQFIYPSSEISPINYQTFTFNSGYLALSTYLPTEYIELCASPHSALCTTETFSPTPVEIQPNSVLGRNGGDLESLSTDELRTILDYTIPDPVTDIEAYPSGFVLNSNYIELAQTENALIVLDEMYFRPRATQPDIKAKGFLFFNDYTKTFQGYDGIKWRSLKWEDEE